MSTPTILGVAVGGAAVGALAFTVFFGRLWRGMGAAVFFALFVSIFLSNSIKDSYNASNVQNFGSAMNDEILPGISDALFGSGGPTEVSDTTETEPKSQGDLGTMERLFREQLRINLVFQKEYETALNAAGFGDLLTPSRFLRDTGGSQTEKIIREARSTVAQFERRAVEEMEKFKEKVRALDLQDKNAETSFMNGALKSMQEAKEFNSKSWTLESDILERGIAMANFLNSNRGKWTADGDQIYFEEDSAVETYNQLQSQMMAVVADQEALLRRRQEQFNSLQEKFKKVLAESGEVSSSKN